MGGKRVTPLTREQRDKYNATRRSDYEKNPELYAKRSRDWRVNHKAQTIYYSAQRRARKKGVPFEIEISDIVIPEYCPVLGIKLEVASGYAQDNSPSLDRIIPALGYVKGNILVISYKANTIKSNATVDELRKVAAFYGNNSSS